VNVGRGGVPKMSPLLQPTTIAVIERAVSDHLSRAWTCGRFTDLADRSSHPAGIFEGPSLSVFAKTNLSSDGRRQFIAELAGLRLIRERAQVTTPVLIGPGIADLKPGAVMLLEAIPERAARCAADWRSIGRTLAAIHMVRAEQFGLELFDGFFGPLPQDNKPVIGGSWADFFTQRRVLPRLRGAVDSGNLPRQVAVDVERLAARIRLFAGPEPEPRLLHGDAQQNNFLSGSAGAAVIDVAPYFGHPEIDLAMLDFFAPVPDTAFHGYREVLPIDPGFPGRRELWRVPAYLAVLEVGVGREFGRGFLRRLVAALDLYR